MNTININKNGIKLRGRLTEGSLIDYKGDKIIITTEDNSVIELEFNNNAVFVEENKNVDETSSEHVIEALPHKNSFVNEEVQGFTVIKPKDGGEYLLSMDAVQTSIITGGLSSMMSYYITRFKGILETLKAKKSLGNVEDIKKSELEALKIYNTLIVRFLPEVQGRNKEILLTTLSSNKEVIEDFIILK
ncbi:hypothetical protein [Clostridium mediterraneense]|uniref:hypothetical protein n=1 Tax=Clostridium mediterraneense TaxID=1805472 RepID=UPI00082C7960|nr:hypothetical protein [Clostridium mediterraneense]